MAEKRTIMLEAIVDYPDDLRPLTLCTALLCKEYSDWLTGMDPFLIQGQGEIELPSGMMKWRAVE